MNHRLRGALSVLVVDILQRGREVEDGGEVARYEKFGDG